MFRRIIPAVTLVLFSCSIDTGCAIRKQAGPPTVVLEGRTGDPVPVKVEIASRPQQQKQGLMFRQQLAPDAGMLFVYQADAPRFFWMKNTYIPLDMLFIGSKLRIVGIIEQTQPLTTSRRSVDLPSKFVLEVNGGFVKKHGIRVGSMVHLENIPEI